MSKAVVKTTFEASRTLRPIYTGGSTALDASGRLLVTCVGEDALVVDLETGDQLVSLEGVSHFSSPTANRNSLIKYIRMERSLPAWPVRCAFLFFVTMSLFVRFTDFGFSHSFGLPCDCLLALNDHAHLLSDAFR